MKNVPRIRITDTHARLTDAERVAMQQRVVSYMRQNPIHAPQKFEMSSIVSPFQFSIPHFKPLLSATMVVLLVFGGTTGVTLAAQSALPGESLYGVKHYSEVAREYIALSPKAKIAIAALRAERRLAEARSLKKSHTLTEDIQKDLEQQFNVHVAEISNVLIENNANIPLSEAAQAVARIEAHLDATYAVGDFPEDTALAMMSAPMAPAPEIVSAKMSMSDAAPSTFSTAREISNVQMAIVADAPMLIEEIEIAPSFEDIARATIAAQEDLIRMHTDKEGYDGIPTLVDTEIERVRELAEGNDGAQSILDAMAIHPEDEDVDPIEALKDVATINVMLE